MSRPGSKLTEEAKTRMINIMRERDRGTYFKDIGQKYNLSESRIRHIYNQGILLEKSGKLFRENRVKMTFRGQELIVDKQIGGLLS